MKRLLLVAACALGVAACGDADNTAQVAGANTPVMNLQLGPLNQTGSNIQVDVTFTLTSQGRQALRIDGLQPGMTMGTGVIQAKAG